MSLRTDTLRRRIKRNSSFGKLASLLTACAVTLIGLAVGLEPYIILWRACVSAVVIGSLISFGLSVIDVANRTK